MKGFSATWERKKGVGSSSFLVGRIQGQALYGYVYTFYITRFDGQQVSFFRVIMRFECFLKCDL